jgi:hypothetical protein
MDLSTFSRSKQQTVTGDALVTQTVSVSYATSEKHIERSFKEQRGTSYLIFFTNTIKNA